MQNDPHPHPLFLFWLAFFCVTMCWKGTVFSWLENRFADERGDFVDGNDIEKLVVMVSKRKNMDVFMEIG